MDADNGYCVDIVDETEAADLLAACGTVVHREPSVPELVAGIAAAGSGTLASRKLTGAMTAARSQRFFNGKMAAIIRPWAANSYRQLDPGFEQWYNDSVDKRIKHLELEKHFRQIGEPPGLAAGWCPFCRCRRLGRDGGVACYVYP